MSDKVPWSWRARTWIVGALAAVIELVEVGHAHVVLCDCDNNEHFASGEAGA